jgi:hypothetical protein
MNPSTLSYSTVINSKTSLDNNSKNTFLDTGHLVSFLASDPESDQFRQVVGGEVIPDKFIIITNKF